MFIKLTTKIDNEKLNTIYVNVDHIQSIRLENDEIHIRYANESEAIFVDTGFNKIIHILTGQVS